MADEPLTWYPLYWLYNDFWKWNYSMPGDKNKPTITYSVEHAGHIHFFMMDFPTTSDSQQAYYGEQKYKFELINVWGEGSNDINQQKNIRVVGKPKWYFYIAEYWRRVYIQDWEYADNSPYEGITDKRGLKYEASKDIHSYGPYREGKDNYFFSTNLNRTLPIEYWKNSEMTIRDHYLRRGENVKTPYEWDFGKLTEDGKKDPKNLGSYPRQIANIPGQSTDQFGNEIKNPEPNQKDPKLYPWEKYFADGDDWTIPRGEVCEGDGVDYSFPGTVSYSDEDKARWNYPDKYFISPVIEYQKVIHSNWERLEGWEENDIDTEVNEDGIETGEDFGDGWEIEITSPFKIDGKIQSPFSDDNGKVYPVGIYCHDLDKKGKIKPLKYNKKFYDPSVKNEDMDKENVDKDEVALSMNKCFPDKEIAYNEKGEQNTVKWNFPEGFPEDGKWVEQCLGAMVVAKARVVLEDNFGGRSVQWITTSSLDLGNQFVGKDDMSVDQSNVGKEKITFTINNLTVDPVTNKKTLVLSDTIIGRLTIFDNNGIIRVVPQKQVGLDAELDFSGVNVTGTWSIEFPK